MRINAAFALARSAAKLAPLIPSEPTSGIASGTPALGSDVALAPLLSDVLAEEVAVFPEAVAAALAEPLPALEDAEALPFPAAAAADEDELEELPDPLEELPDPDAAAPPPVEATAAAADEDELEELELVGVVVEDGVPELDDPDPLAPAPAAPPSDATAAAADEDELEDELEPLPDPALDAPDPALAPAAPVPPDTAATAEPVEDELLEAAEAIPAESKTTSNDNNILFIFD